MSPVRASLREHGDESDGAVVGGGGGVLDVVFREDESRVRRDPGGTNLSVLRHLGLNLLRRTETTRKRSLRLKWKVAGWSPAFLMAAVEI